MCKERTKVIGSHCPDIFVVVVVAVAAVVGFAVVNISIFQYTVYLNLIVIFHRPSCSSIEYESKCVCV